jgi:hypothetical protein
MNLNSKVIKYLKSPGFFYIVGLGGAFFSLLYFTYKTDPGLTRLESFEVLLFASLTIPGSILLLYPLFKELAHAAWFHHVKKWVQIGTVPIVALIAWSYANSSIFYLTGIDPYSTPISTTLFSLVLTVAIWLIGTSLCLPLLGILLIIITGLIAMLFYWLKMIQRIIIIIFKLFYARKKISIKKYIHKLNFRLARTKKTTKNEIIEPLYGFGFYISIILLIMYSILLGVWLLKFFVTHPDFSDSIIYSLDYLQCTQKICGDHHSNKRFVFLNTDTYSIMEFNPSTNKYTFKIKKI